MHPSISNTPTPSTILITLTTPVRRDAAKESAMFPVCYLLDGHAIAYRAYYALTGGVEEVARRWITSKGEPTAAAYGFTSVLLRVLQDQPDYLAVAFDAGRSFRDTLYPEYKATRTSS